MSTAPTYDRSREDEEVRPPLYAAASVGAPDQDRNVTVSGRPIRGRIVLSTCYTPPWWYANCVNCSAYIGQKDSPDDPHLLAWAKLHRCGADTVEEIVAALPDPAAVSA